MLVNPDCEIARRFVMDFNECEVAGRICATAHAHIGTDSVDVASGAPSLVHTLGLSYL